MPANDKFWTDITLFSSWFIIVATLKSASLTSPSFVVKILPPLISLCIMFLECKNSRPASTYSIYNAAKLSLIFPNFLINESRDPFSIYSSTILRYSSVWIQSKYFTILGCSIFLRRFISVFMDPFLSSLIWSSDTYLIATSDPFCILRAL